MLERGLKQTRRKVHEAKLFAADIGPGSFIGVRVGVTLAKTFAFANRVLAAGATCFDLIAPDRTVAIPSKKGEFFVREPGVEPYRTTDLPEADLLGYGPGVAVQSYPNAAAFASILSELEPMAPEFLLPQYLIEPSISTPKKSYLQRVNPNG